MRHRIYRTCGLAAMLVCPLAVLADTTGTPTLATGQELNLSTGAVGTSGGDIQWVSTSGMVMLNGAKNYDLPGTEGSSLYSTFTLSLIQTELSSGAVTPTSSTISASTLVVGNLFFVETSGGVIAKVLVTAVSGTSITIQFDTFNPSSGGGSTGGGSTTPSISAVLDAGSYTANIAQGSVFVVKGTNLSPSGLGTNGVLYTSYPLPQSTNNVSIKFAPVSGGTATQAYMVYLFNNGTANQLAGVLPSTVSPGNYNVTVTNGTSTSSSFAVQVVASKPGIVTQDSSGSGLAVVTNYVSASEPDDVNRFTTGAVNGSYISPAHPGQVITIWLTGMGPVPFADNTAPDGGQGYNFLTNGGSVTVYVNGQAITGSAIGYAGRAPCCAGEDQIDVTLPSNVITSCTSSLQVSVNGNLSPAVFISIAPTGASACVSPVYTTAQLQAFDNGTLVYSGSFGLTSLNATEASLGNIIEYSASGSFSSTTGFELPYTGASPTSITSGTCIVIPVLPNLLGTGSVTTTSTNLDAGQITLTGPSASNLSATPFTETSNTYDLSIGEQGLPSEVASQYGNGSIVPGTYTLKASGGHDVGAFSATVTLGPTFTLTGGLPTTINRSAGLTLNWTGGNSTDAVVIFGEAAVGSVANSDQTGGIFECFTTAGKGTFTVPASILTQLPAVTSAQISGETATGSIAVVTSVQPSSGDGYFNAPLTSGGTITNATFLGSTELFGDAVYQ